LFLDRSRAMPYTYRDPSSRKGTLFEDCDFLANDSSLFYNDKPPIPFVWKRPGVSLFYLFIFVNCLQDNK
uniref:Calpain catalytic domain-containing protein n=1 Tax=Pseudonaja textilis TaxID=8673 RepID=A0A670ZAL9_PSETE